MNRLEKIIKTIHQLGIKSVIEYGVYRLGLISGHYQRVTPSNFFLPIQEFLPDKVNWPFPKPSSPELINILQGEKDTLLFEAQEVIDGKVRLFGSPAIPLILTPPGELFHWSEYESGNVSIGTGDIKLVWEPARFGWIFPLARAFTLTGDDKYALCFWNNFEKFSAANPFNLGPNWASAQEVALRLLALIFGGSAFKEAKSSTPDRMQMLLTSIYMHARRIPPTLWYARSQNNNHLVSEAVGLFSAGCLFSTLKEGKDWQGTGWKWFNSAIQLQIAADGEYIQHSTNYHRLVLQLSLWMYVVSHQFHQQLPNQTLTKLTSATRWLSALIEPSNGQVPNLGHNDGSNILPLSPCQYQDFRPVAQAAARAFLGESIFPAGSWDELSLWLGLTKTHQSTKHLSPTPLENLVLIGNKESRAFLRTAHYINRPAHADQLHLDLWFKGYNLTLDAGTFLYNAASPWENSLAGSLVHNTLTIDDQDQMNRAGKFLWLDWAQSRVIEYDPDINEVIADHNGYQRLGMIHRRQLRMVNPLEWQVTDSLTYCNQFRNTHRARIHWLLPDWPWTINDNELILDAPFGNFMISFLSTPGVSCDFDLIRCGKSLLLKPSTPAILGWHSPTYNQLLPALSFCCSFGISPSVTNQAITSNLKIIQK